MDINRIDEVRNLIKEWEFTKIVLGYWETATRFAHDTVSTGTASDADFEAYKKQKIESLTNDIIKLEEKFKEL